MVRELTPRFMSNQEKVAELIPDALAQESSFLHGELNDQVLAEYVYFCRQPVMSIGAGPVSSARPHTLVTERYANAYFGIAQSIEVDSLRAAIEVVFPEDSDPRRNICLAALIIAVCTSSAYTRPCGPTRRAMRIVNQPLPAPMSATTDASAIAIASMI